MKSLSYILACRVQNHLKTYSLAYADPEYKVGYAYVMNKMDYYNINDPREIALRETMYECIRKQN